MLIEDTRRISPPSGFERKCNISLHLTRFFPPQESPEQLLLLASAERLGFGLGCDICIRLRPLQRRLRARCRCIASAKKPTLVVRLAVRLIVPMFAFRRHLIWRGETTGGGCGAAEQNHERDRDGMRQQEKTTCWHYSLPNAHARSGGAEAVPRINTRIKCEQAEARKAVGADMGQQWSAIPAHQGHFTAKRESVRRNPHQRSRRRESCAIPSSRVCEDFG